jgi:hypothetical protein
MSQSPSSAKEEFETALASTIKAPNALLIGITSPPAGGKTKSALRLATGISRVLGWKIGLADTEGGRGLAYRDQFVYDYTRFPAPFNPLRYMRVGQHMMAKGARILIFDSMSHEHNGPGGYLQMAQKYVEERVAEKVRKGDDRPEWQIRESYKWASLIEPAAERTALQMWIEQVGADAVFIFCYRGKEKVKPGPGGKPVEQGISAESTSSLPYMMTVRFLLPPGSDGRPDVNPKQAYAKLSVKNPDFIRDMLKPGLQLNEELGERLAKWQQGGTGMDPAARAHAAKRAEWMKTWEGKGVDEARVLAALGVNFVEQIVDQHLKTFREWALAIKDGKRTIDDVFPRLPDAAAEPETADDDGGGTLSAEELARMQEEQAAAEAAKDGGIT